LITLDTTENLCKIRFDFQQVLTKAGLEIIEYPLAKSTPVILHLIRIGKDSFEALFFNSSNGMPVKI